MLKAAAELSTLLPESSVALASSSGEAKAEGPPAEGGIKDFDQHCVHADSALIATRFPEILHWGLSDRILDLAEAHLGCAPALIGTALRRDSPTGEQTGTRFWHLDGEDRQVFKILIYLNDVSVENGPFEYVPKPCYDPAYRRLSPRYHYFWRYFCRDSDFAKVVPQRQWRAATGPAGTILLADTASVFHHGAIAYRGERLMLSFAYTSQRPVDRPLAEQFFPAAEQLLELSPQFSARQRNCLFAWRGWETEAMLRAQR